jgi:hypothetical protein
MSAGIALELENYIMIDSDSYFIKEFFESDFIYSGNIPYTVCHQQKELWEYNMERSARDNFFRMQHCSDHIGFCKTRKEVQDMMERPGKALDFGPGPVVWHTEVWRDLDVLCREGGETFGSLIEKVPSEFTWYGETLLTQETIPLIPLDPLFKFFHHREQYFDYKERGITEEMLSQQYLGIVMQSNWKAPTSY